MSNIAPTDCYEVIGLGEAGIDFLPSQAGETLMDAARFTCLPGGSPINCLVAMSKHGCSTAFIARLGNDWWGKRIENEVARHGVASNFLSFDPIAPSTIAFSTDGLTGEAQFAVYGYPGAFSNLETMNVPVEVIRKAQIFIFSSLTLDRKPAFEATWAGVSAANDADVLVVFDPNYRPPQWPNASTAKNVLTEAAAAATILKINTDELKLLTGSAEPETARQLLRHRTMLVVVTLGSDGAVLVNRKKVVRVPPFTRFANPARMLGCGDAFLGVFLAGLLGHFPEIVPSPVGLDDLEPLTALVELANAAGSWMVDQTGLWNAFPKHDELLSFYQDRVKK